MDTLPRRATLSAERVRSAQLKEARQDAEPPPETGPNRGVKNMPLKTEHDIAKATAAQYVTAAAKMQVIVDTFYRAKLERDLLTLGGCIGGYRFENAKARLLYCRNQAHHYATEAARLDPEAARQQKVTANIVATLARVRRQRGGDGDA
jgi:hypothetical protein